MSWQLPEWFKDGLLKAFLAFLILMLIKGAMTILKSELHHFREAFGSEIKDAAKGSKTVGSLNWLQFVGVALFGIIIIVASTGQKILGISLASFLGEKKANELAKYSDYSSLFFVLAILMVVSLICVIVDNRSRK